LAYESKYGEVQNNEDFKNFTIDLDMKYLDSIINIPELMDYKTEEELLDELKEEKLLKDFKKVHILITCPIEKIDLIISELTKIKNNDFIEYEQSQN
jgi:hypothetical protein